LHHSLHHIVPVALGLLIVMSCMFQIQLLAYNSDLYGNVSQALASSNGLATIALLGQVRRNRNSTTTRN